MMDWFELIAVLLNIASSLFSYSNYKAMRRQRDYYRDQLARANRALLLLQKDGWRKLEEGARPRDGRGRWLPRKDT